MPEKTPNTSRELDRLAEQTEQANCVIKGLRLNLWLSFDNCRFP